MNDPEHDPELLEAELRKLAPAPPPAEFMARLTALRPAAHVRPTKLPPLEPSAFWRLLLRWLVPVTAASALAAALLMWWPSKSADPQPPKHVLAAAQKPSKGKDIEIDRQLVAAFDAVARLPGGEPVRFRCREWTDAVVLRDPASGIVIERRTPRLEVVPVSFETY